MRKRVLWILCLIACLGVCACGKGSGDAGDMTINIETGAQSLTSLGEFPVGQAGYVPAKITIDSPATDAPITVAQLAQDNWTLAVEGTLTEPQLDGRTMEIAAVYVNWERLDESKGDSLRYDNGKIRYRKYLHLTAEDVRQIYYPIVVAVVDDRHYVTGAREVVVLQDGTPNALGMTFPNAVYGQGDKAFTKNLITTILAAIDGQNLAAYLPRIERTWPTQDEGDKKFRMAPRDVMLQGIQVLGYKVAGDPQQYDITVSLRVSNLVVEYSTYSDLKKGRNYANMRARNVDLLDALVISIKKSTGGLGYTAELATAPTIRFAKAPGYRADLDTFFLSAVANVFDFFLSFLQDEFKLGQVQPIRIPIPVTIMNRLLAQMVGGHSLVSQPEPSLHDLFIDNERFSFIADMQLNSDAFRATYATPGNDAGTPDTTPHTTNSVFALSDDFINQVIACYLTNKANDESDVVIQGDDLAAYIEQFKEQLGLPEGTTIGIWDWLKEVNGGGYPTLKIRVNLKTPPILELDGTDGGVGIVHVRNACIEIQADYPKDTSLDPLLARLCIDMDLRARWGAGGLELDLPNGGARYTMLFNKLYPIVLPIQMRQIPVVIAQSLNDVLEKCGLAGYAIKHGKACGGYLVLEGDLKTEKDLTRMARHTYAGFAGTDWKQAPQGLASFVRGYALEGYPIEKEVIDLNGSVSGLFRAPNGAASGGNGLVFAAKTTDLNWDDGLAFSFTAPEGHLIAHIAFQPEISFTDMIGSDLDFYEEFALVCITRESFLPSVGGGSTDQRTEDPSLVPAHAVALPKEMEFNDLKPVEASGAHVLIRTDAVQTDLPFTQTAGIGLRLRKTPIFPLLTGIEMAASIGQIEIYTLDLHLKPMKF